MEGWDWQENGPIHSFAMIPHNSSISFASSFLSLSIQGILFIFCVLSKPNPFKFSLFSWLYCFQESFNRMMWFFWNFLWGKFESSFWILLWWKTFKLLGYLVIRKTQIFGLNFKANLVITNCRINNNYWKLFPLHSL